MAQDSRGRELYGMKVSHSKQLKLKQLLADLSNIVSSPDQDLSFLLLVWIRSLYGLEHKRKAFEISLDSVEACEPIVSETITVLADSYFVVVKGSFDEASIFLAQPSHLSKICLKLLPTEDVIYLAPVAAKGGVTMDFDTVSDICTTFYISGFGEYASLANKLKEKFTNGSLFDVK